MNKRVTACLVLSPFAFLAIAIEPVKLIVSGADRTIIFALLLIAAEVWLLCSAKAMRQGVLQMWLRLPVYSGIRTYQ